MRGSSKAKHVSRLFSPYIKACTVYQGTSVETGMQTCANCKYFVPTEGNTATLMATGEKVQVGDCRRYPPAHVMNVLTSSEKEQSKESELETPRTARQYASPFYWLTVPEYANAYAGTNVKLWCGEWRRHESAGDNGASASSHE